MSLLCSKSSPVSQAINGASQSPGCDLQALCTLASLYTLVSLICFSPTPLLTLCQFHWTQFLKLSQHILISGLLYYLSPLIRRLLSLIFSIFYSLTYCKSLFNSHHLNRQHCPTYLKLYFTPSFHIPSYLLSSITLIIYSNTLYSFHIYVYCFSSH